MQSVLQFYISRQIQHNKFLNIEMFLDRFIFIVLFLLFYINFELTIV